MSLTGVHPTLAAKVTNILLAMAALEHPMCVTAGVRTTAEQQALYAQGRTVPGAIVTQADGVIKQSKHQVHADGFGHAVDCAFLVDGAPSWAEDQPWTLYGEMARTSGLVWGGDWSTLRDRPHLELPA